MKTFYLDNIGIVNYYPEHESLAIHESLFNNPEIYDAIKNLNLTITSLNMYRTDPKKAYYLSQHEWSRLVEYSKDKGIKGYNVFINFSFNEDNLKECNSIKGLRISSKSKKNTLTLDLSLFPNITNVSSEKITTNLSSDHELSFTAEKNLDLLTLNFKKVNEIRFWQGKVLDLSNSRIDSAKEIIFYSVGKVIDFSNLNIQDAERIEFDRVNVDFIDEKFFSLLKEDCRLFIFNCKNLKSIKGIKNLKTISIDGTKIEDNDTSPLLNCSGYVFFNSLKSYNYSLKEVLKLKPHERE